MLTLAYLSCNMEELHSAISKGGSVVAWKDLQPVFSLQSQQDATLRRSSEIKVTLVNEELWEKFHSITNEMIVTRAGRRMFPLLQINLSSLEPSQMYAVLLEFKPTHTHRWRFLNGEWQVGSNITDSTDTDHYVYVHPTSPTSGLHWMKEPVCFTKLKLSNKESGNGKVKLNSLHRYQPCVHVVRLASLLEQQPDVMSHTFTTTQFIAVTAYQNEKITQMKIKHNPFAKAFLSSQETKPEDLTATSRPTSVMTTSTIPHPHSFTVSHFSPPPAFNHAPQQVGHPGYPYQGASLLPPAPLSHYSTPMTNQQFSTDGHFQYNHVYFTNRTPSDYGLAHGPSFSHNLT